MTQQLWTESDPRSTGISIALIVLDLFVVVGFLGSSALLVARRQKGVDWDILPIWAIMAALWAWAWSYIWYVVEGIRDRLTTPFELVETNSIYHLLCLLFEHAAICFLFCVFYRLTHILLKLSRYGAKLPAKINAIHWVIFSFLVAISIANFALWVIIYFAFLVVEWNYQPVEITRLVILWVASWEITAWAAYIAIKARRAKSNLAAPAVALLCGSTAYAAMTFMWLVDFLRWYQPMYSYTFKEDTSSLAVRSFLEIFFCVGTYGGILSFCVLSHRLQKKGDRDTELQPTGAQSRAVG
ncbi:hypothetical protein N7452_006292 [Penicillium brevicompactum]|uniref:Uncharacterized protein n=1 Tax=Penicillium brevicompactum TaxID=5074 RepID=A0A9W9QMM5_PENBR|nr:hypothetical protein N7452_006292 [Penicillium brevicompactum]